LLDDPQSQRVIAADDDVPLHASTLLRKPSA
jgi:hypothetical protein